jgi:hypothetical protein
VPRGGKRTRSGRKPLHESEICRWLVRRVRELGTGEEMNRERQLQFMKRNFKNQVENFVELQTNYQSLKQTTEQRRRAMVADDCGTPLEEARELLATEGFPRHLQLPPPNQFQMNRIYNQVATEASVHFGKLISVRNAKDFLAAWLKYEKSFSRDCQ